MGGAFQPQTQGNGRRLQKRAWVCALYRGECFTLEAVPRANFEREVRRTPEKPSWGGGTPRSFGGGNLP